MSSDPSNTTCTAKIVNTAMRMCDRPFCSRNVPWGISGFGVVFIVVQRPFVIGFYLSPRGFPFTPGQILVARVRALQIIYRLAKHFAAVLVILKLVKARASGRKQND